MSLRVEGFLFLHDHRVNLLELRVLNFEWSILYTIFYRSRLMLRKFLQRRYHAIVQEKAIMMHLLVLHVAYHGYAGLRVEHVLSVLRPLRVLQLSFRALINIADDLREPENALRHGK